MKRKKRMPAKRSRSSSTRKSKSFKRPGLFSVRALVVFALIFGVAGAYFITRTEAETREGTFIVKCTFSHRKQVDPIVQPGPAGTLSGHMHDFTGNRSTDSFSTYESMITAGTTCAHPGDTAGYWFPSLVDPNGQAVTPVFSFAYYKNIPVSYSTTRPFPPNFRMIAGGVNAGGQVFWDCFNGGGHYSSPPACGNDFTVARIHFPSCWDGKNLDSPDHRSHVAYTRSGGCPSTHPVKVPRINFFMRFPKNIGGPGWKLSDGTTLPHADFWNTWQQPALEDLVRRCLNAGVNCGQVRS